MRRSSRLHSPLLSCLTALSVLVSACHRQTESSTSPNTAAIKSSTSAPTKTYSSGDLVKVCGGQGIDLASAYKKQPGEVTPTRVFLRQSGKDKYLWKSTALPAEWRSPNYRNIQLIACVSEGKRNLAQTCQYKSRKNNSIRLLERYDITYTFALREVKSGKQIASRKVLSKIRSDCPPILRFTRLTKKQTQVASFEPLLKSFLTPYVNPSSS